MGKFRRRHSKSSTVAQNYYMDGLSFSLTTFHNNSGSLHRRPSELVDKILKTLRDRERNFQRSSSTFSTGSHSIPSRFKIMDPNRTTFDSLVQQVAVKAAEKEKPNSFRSLARSVLSPENRSWRQGTTFIIFKIQYFCSNRTVIFVRK